MLLSLLFSALTGAVTADTASAALASAQAPAQAQIKTAPPTFDLPESVSAYPGNEGELPPSPIGPAIAELRASWSADVNALDEHSFEVMFKMWPLRSGGSGEGMLQLKRRAEKMRRDLGYARYRISDYSEGVESNFPFAQRFVYAILEFEGKR